VNAGRPIWKTAITDHLKTDLQETLWREARWLEEYGDSGSAIQMWMIMVCGPLYVPPAPVATRRKPIV